VLSRRPRSCAGGDAYDEDEHLIQLLWDIRTAFGGAETIFTVALLWKLNQLDESQWV
jgi:hypothetical protein